LNGNLCNLFSWLAIRLQQNIGEIDRDCRKSRLALIWVEKIGPIWSHVGIRKCCQSFQLVFDFCCHGFLFFICKKCFLDFVAKANTENATMPLNVFFFGKNWF
jgi:hypothetical protein